MGADESQPGSFKYHRLIITRSERVILDQMNNTRHKVDEV